MSNTDELIEKLRSAMNTLAHENSMLKFRLGNTEEELNGAVDDKILAERSSHKFMCDYIVMRDRFSAANEECDKLRAEVERLKQDNHNIQDNYGIAEKSIAYLRAQLAAAQTEMASLKNALDVGQANCDDIYNDLKRERDVAKAKLQLANEKLAAAQEDTRRLEQLLAHPSVPQWLAANVRAAREGGAR